MNEKDFYKITAMSVNFSAYCDEVKDGKVKLVSQDVLLWQARFELAIAQQLTVIAGYLGKIVGKAEELNGR